ncbi:hypothetical protein RN001_003607 [Aquatica leii]|uniref:Chromo domain-containing protein n=1 Tax=Aquatica leii TaxID=1421715 RepID=A0AAN7PNY7_9COLE|nr:hypothetical protein RN001_003607 [Aquatica leii]
MSNRLKEELIRARKAVKRKADSLKADTSQKESIIQQQFKPITQPLKELLTTIKPDSEFTVKKQPDVTVSIKKQLSSNISEKVKQGSVELKSQITDQFKPSHASTPTRPSTHHTSGQPKEITLQGSYKWLNLLPLIVKNYNSTTHRTTGYKPIDVNKNNSKNILKSRFDNRKVLDLKTPKFSKGAFVRISKHRGVFAKGFTPNWSTEIFQVMTVQNTNPTTYILKDVKDQQIKGGFYEQELQEVKYADIYLVEKILKRRGNRLYVKWLGLDKSHNSWINNSAVI